MNNYIEHYIIYILLYTRYLRMYVISYSLLGKTIKLLLPPAATRKGVIGF